jgi:hypothetical protein
MKELNKNWITEGLIDFEYKKYLLLDYLQYVKANFNDKKLYPHLSDLLFHYKNLLSIKENKKLLRENFPKQISKADFEKLEIIYDDLIHDDKVMQDIEEILIYSLPKLKDHLNEGKDLYDFVEDKLTISSVGVSPLYPDEGYLLIHKPGRSETRIYEYQISIFHNADEKYRGVHTHFLETVSKSVFETVESIKIDLIRKYKKMPNPATYLVGSKVDYPFQETLLPIAKRLLVKYIYSGEAM